MAVFSLAACSSGSKDIATMKGSTITVDDFITKLKNKALANKRLAKWLFIKSLKKNMATK